MLIRVQLKLQTMPLGEGLRIGLGHALLLQRLMSSGPEISSYGNAPGRMEGSGAFAHRTDTGGYNQFHVKATLTGPQQRYFAVNNMATNECLFEDCFDLSDFTGFDSELHKLVKSSEPDTQTFLNTECLFDTSTQAFDPEVPNAEVQEIIHLKETIRDLEKRVEMLERYLNSSAASRDISLTVHCSLLLPRDKWEQDFSSWAVSVNKLLTIIMEGKASDQGLSRDQLVGAEQWVDTLCDPASTQTQYSQ
ncbi:hypothetical protein FGG08_003150 [Glutinoglossum americanum]|uniref:Uncharacterized protein n=1 Tax=Glutinoglossum americanum TaxID=1670608 RepID=A0A9P8L3W2_9PEZI|nr:hypothetical protein FGG08_003150 [Glutinoglossum americanum]